MEIISKNYLSTLTATGASQTPLEGNALASGCTGCEGDGIYATITKVLFSDKWYSGVESLIIEDAVAEATAGTAYSRQLVVYACYANSAPKQVAASNLDFIPEPKEGISVSPTGEVTIESTATAGNYVITATGKKVEDENGNVISDGSHLVAEAVIVVA